MLPWAGFTAHRLGYRVERHSADWARHGRGAGMIRNHAMIAAGPDVVIAFPTPAVSRHPRMRPRRGARRHPS